MKKLLLTALTCLGLGSFANAAPFVEGQAYRLKHNSSEFYFNMEIDGRGDASGRHCASLVPQDQASVLYFVQNPNEATQWQIHVNSAEGPNLSSDSSWHSIINSSDNYYWTVNEFEGEDNIVVFTRTGTATASANCLGPNLNGAADAAGLWSNQDGSNADKLNNCKWLVEAVDNVTSITINYVLEAGGEPLVTTVTSVENVGTQITLSAPAFTNLPEGQNSITTVANQTVYEVIVTPDIPFAYTENESDAKIWQLVGQHSNQVAVGHMWKYPGDDTEIPTEDLPRSINSVFTENHLFAFVGNLKDGFKIYNKAAGETKTLYDTGSNAYRIGEAGNGTTNVWKIFPLDGNASNHDFACFSKNGTNFINWQGNALKTWTDDDGGSACYFYAPADPAIEFYQTYADGQGLYDVSSCAELYAEVISNRYDFEKAMELRTVLLNCPASPTYQRNQLATTAQKYIAIGVCTDDAIAEWNAALEAFTGTQESYTALEAVFNKLFETVKEVSVEISHAVKNGKIGLNSAKTSIELNENNVGTYAWTLKPASDGGFYLFNEYANKYFKHAQRDNSNATLVDNQTSASVYHFDIFAENESSIALGIYTSDTPNDHGYMHSNANSSIFPWIAGTNSSWHVACVEESQAASEHLAGAVNASNLSEGTSYGTALHQYTTDDVDALLAARATAEDATAEVKRQAAATIYAQLATRILNTPKQGRFYRLKGSDKYLTATTSDNGRILMGATENNGAISVVYYTPDNKLVSLANGLVLGNFSSTDGSRASWSFVAPESGSAGTVTFSESTSTPGQYKIGISGSGSDRYIYHAGTGDVVNVDCGSSDSNNGYAWTIEEATWLPLPVNGNNVITIFSPVALYDQEGRLTLHTLKSNGQHAEIIKESTNDARILPNTPYFAEVKDVDSATGCSFVRIDYDFDAPASYADEAVSVDPVVNGSFLAKTVSSDEETSYYTLGMKDENAHFLNVFATNNDETTQTVTIPGFTAHVASTAPSAAVNTLGGFKVVAQNEATTSIREVEAAAQGADTIYDLSGRRVSKAARGLYIINGKKVLVK